MASTELTARKVAYFVRLYNSPKENGTFRTLAEIAESQGYSTPAMTQILKDAGVTITRGKRPTRLNGREYRGKQTGRFKRVMLTLPKLRDQRLKLKLSQRKVSETLGVYKHWISNLENNMLRPTPKRIRAYADALHALSPKSSPSRRASALAACRAFEDTDGVTERPAARKSRAGSWGEFLDGLTDQEMSGLQSALQYRAEQWRTGRRADRRGRVRGANRNKLSAAEYKRRRARAA